MRDCSADEPLDAIIPFSSLILLGVVVAVEDRYGIRITREQLARVTFAQNRPEFGLDA